MLVLPALGAYIALAQADPAPVEPEQADHAVAAQVDVITRQGRKLRIGDAPVPTPREFLRQGALDDEIPDVAFDAALAGCVRRIAGSWDKVVTSRPRVMWHIQDRGHTSRPHYGRLITVDTRT
jgi:hypothetical protein